MIEALVAKWGYAAVAAGVFFEGETIVVVAGAMAHRGFLSLPLVMLSAFLGTLFGDQLWFHLGRRYGRGFIERRPKWRSRAERAQVLLDRFGTLFVLAFRFLYGLRTVTPVFLGAANYPVPRFAVLNTISAALWAVAFSAAGYGIGASMRTILGRATHIEELILGAFVASVVLWILTRRVRTARQKPSSA